MAFGPNPPKIQAHLCVEGGLAAIAFYEQAFSARCAMQQMADDGVHVLHANIELFGGEVMLQDAFPEMASDVLAPPALGGTSVAVSINLTAPADVDAAIERATAAGATAILPPADQFWGARYGRIRDPFGHVWAFNAPLPQTE